MTLHLERARCDEEAARLLPWYIAGRLSAGDVERVASHLQRCAICRSDAAHERVVRELMKADARVEYAPQAGLAKTLSRIDELGRDAPTAPTAPTAPSAPTRITPVQVSRRRFGAVQWLSAAALVQAVALGWLGMSPHYRPAPMTPTPQYETLSEDPGTAAPGPHIRAVFAPSMTLADLQALLAANRLTVVRGPSDAGAYTLACTDTRVTASMLVPTIAALRADGRVLFVESAVNDAPAVR